MSKKITTSSRFWNKTTQRLSLGFSGIVALFGIQQEEQVIAAEQSDRLTGKQNELNMQTEKLYVYQKQTKIPAAKELSQASTKLVASAPIVQENEEMVVKPLQSTSHSNSIQESSSPHSEESQSSISQSTSQKASQAISQKASQSTSQKASQSVTNMQSQSKSDQGVHVSQTNSSELSSVSESNTIKSENSQTSFVASVMHSQSLSLSASESLKVLENSQLATSELVSDALSDDFDLDFWLS
ncbi:MULTISPECIES: hypothetical protein [Enterococcus]|uniref:Uncharacterized protein n=1 Tax=Enterococcus sulfureus ATCC 49903 TaxID=1140003 RepID=S0P3K0_9ENTE|nr:hypothetical protein [Enterococcus sulfureus]EOT45923.1 hypothetical protein OMY_01944 [Enterococcus sulfureus ATCC 49903]EOT83026.1 hypothetical protein I573_02139 [Enterococcus sulfureus ATCC 49903]